MEQEVAFLHESSICIRYSLAVLAALCLLVYVPNGSGVSPHCIFFLPLYAFMCVGSNLGRTLNMIHSAIFALLWMWMESTIVVPLCFNKWVTVAMVFVVTFINLYVLQLAANPIQKSIAAGLVLVLVVVFAEMRIEKSVGVAIGGLWWGLSDPLLGICCALMAVLFPFPIMATIQLECRLIEMENKTADITKTLVCLCELASQNHRSEHFSHVLHLLRMEIYIEHKKTPAVRLLYQDACWELPLTYYWNKTALTASERISECHTVLCKVELSVSSLTLMSDNGFVNDSNSRVFLAVAYPSFQMLRLAAENMLKKAVPRLGASWENEYENTINIARIALLKSQHEAPTTKDRREKLGYLYTLQNNMFDILKTFMKRPPTDLSVNHSWNLFMGNRHTHFFASLPQLRSLERISESSKFALAACIAQLLTYLLPLVFSYGDENKTFYAAVTVALIASVENSGSTVNKSVYRVCGTSIGGIFTIFVFLIDIEYLNSDAIFPTIMFSLWSFFSAYVWRNSDEHSYAGFVMGITPLIIALNQFSYFTNTDSAIGLLLVRLVDTAVASALVMTAAVIYPFRAVDKLHLITAACMLDTMSISEQVLSSKSLNESFAPLEISIGKVSSLIGPSRQEPVLWHKQFPHETFTLLYARLVTNSDILRAMSDAMQISDVPLKNCVYGDVFAQMSDARPTIVSIFKELNEAFKPPNHRTSTVSFEKMHFELEETFGAMDVEIGTSVEKIMTAMVGGEHADNPGIYSRQAISFLSFAHHYFLFYRNVKLILYHAQVYLLAIDYIHLPQLRTPSV